MMINFLPKVVSILLGPQFSFIGGLIQAGASLFGANQAAQQQNDAARFSAREAQLQPYNIYSGTGAVQFDTPFQGFNQNYNPYGPYNPNSFFGGGPSSSSSPFIKQGPVSSPTNAGNVNINGSSIPVQSFSGGFNSQGTPNRGVDNRQLSSGIYNPPSGGPGTISQAPQQGQRDPIYDGVSDHFENLFFKNGIKGNLRESVLADPLNLFSPPQFDTSPLPLKDPRNVFTQLDPRLQGLSNNLFQSGGALLNSQIQGPRSIDPFGGLGLSQFAAAQAQADPFFNESGNQLGQTPGQPFFNQLQSDPYDIASSEFEKLESVLQPGRDRQTRALEERLLAQGRLGSSGGALSEQAQQEAFDTSSRANLAQALNTGLQTQNQLYGIGSGLENLSQQRANLLSNLGSQQGNFFAGIGQGLSGIGLQNRAQDIGLRSQDIARRAQDINFSNSGLQRLMAGLQIEQSPLELLRLSSALGGNSANPGANNLFTAGQNAADTTAAAYSSLGQGLGGLFGGR